LEVQNRLPIIKNLDLTDSAVFILKRMFKPIKMHVFMPKT